MRVSSIKYPSIHAKLSGMYASKLKKKDLEELLKQNSTKQAIVLLKSLNDSFKDLEDNSRRINLKILLDDIFIEDVKKIYRLLDKYDKPVFFKFLSIYEIKCLKSVFRKLSSNSVLNEKTNEVENWSQKLFRNIKGLENVKDYNEFLEIVKLTQYAKIFKKYEKNIEQINIFEIENELDKFYFENVLVISKKYNNNLEDMIGKMVDLNNIIWIYRVKKYYNFSTEDARNVTIHQSYKLKKSELQQLLETESENEFVNILNTLYYAKYMDFLELDNLEQQKDRYLYYLYKKNLNRNIFDISSIYAYFAMLELENNDILNIVEGIRYKLSKEEIRKKLVR